MAVINSIAWGRCLVFVVSWKLLKTNMLSEFLVDHATLDLFVADETFFEWRAMGHGSLFLDHARPDPLKYDDDTQR